MAAENHNCRIKRCPLRYENHAYTIDFELLEKIAAEPDSKMLIFCSPHNPVGRVWTKEELKQVGEICLKYGIKIVSDEIHSDLIMPGHTHTVFSQAGDFGDEVIVCTAPSKTFNLAGPVGSYHIIYNQYLRDRVVAKGEKPHYNSMNVLSMYALIGAYKPEGYEWVDELRQTITGNVDFACAYIAEHFHGVKVSRPQGTYMLFLDCTEWCEAHGKTIDELEQAGWDVGVAWQDKYVFNA